MDAEVSTSLSASPPGPKQGLSEHVRAAPQPAVPRPSREEAEAAVRTLLAYAGDNPRPRGPARYAEARGRRL